MPCKLNHYCVDGLRYQCPANAPVTQWTGTDSLDGCLTCVQRNGNSANPIYDDLVGDCVSCYEYDSSTPIWDSNACVACASGTSFNGETGLCEGNCPGNINDAGVCILTAKLNECESGYIGIMTAEQLAKIGVDENYPLDGSYCLLNDISLAAYGENYNNGEGWIPIGSDTNKFEGIFDGNNNEISDLYINRPSARYQGLFGYVSGSSVQIRNLGVVNVDVVGDGWVAGLVGQNDDGAISNTYVNGSVEASDGACGGLAGWNRGNIQNSYAIGTVASPFTDSQVGGLVGLHFNGDIYNSYALVDVTGVGYVGGLVGEISGGGIYISYATGTVTGNGSVVGGLVGKLGEANIYYSHATGNVNAISSSVGGLVGNTYWSTISNSYATGAVTGTGAYRSVGGLVGESIEDVTINNSYATGAVTGEEYVGGLIGQGSSSTTISASYFDTETTGQMLTCGYGTCDTTGKTTSEMQTPQTFIDAGWDTTIWSLVQGQYPKLKGIGGQD